MTTEYTDLTTGDRIDQNGRAVSCRDHVQQFPDVLIPLEQTSRSVPHSEPPGIGWRHVPRVAVHHQGAYRPGQLLP